MIDNTYPEPDTENAEPKPESSLDGAGSAEHIFANEELINLSTEGQVNPPFSSRKVSNAEMLAAVGGHKGISSGEWLIRLIALSMRANATNGTSEYLRTKYPKLDANALSAKLISIAARNAGLIGAATGAAITADEIATLASLGLAAPVGISIAIGGVALDLVSVTYMQLRLISVLAVLHGPPLDPEDPEDVLLVIKYFLGGKAGAASTTITTRMGVQLAGNLTKQALSKERLKLAQSLAKKLGIKLLQRSAVNVVIPVVSIGLGAGSNYFVTRSIGRRANRELKARGEEIAAGLL